MVFKPSREGSTVNAYPAFDPVDLRRSLELTRRPKLFLFLPLLGDTNANVNVSAQTVPIEVMHGWPLASDIVGLTL